MSPPLRSARFASLTARSAPLRTHRILVGPSGQFFRGDPQNSFVGGPWQRDAMALILAATAAKVRVPAGAYAYSRKNPLTFRKSSCELTQKHIQHTPTTKHPSFTLNHTLITCKTAKLSQISADFSPIKTMQRSHLKQSHIR